MTRTSLRHMRLERRSSSASRRFRLPLRNSKLPLAIRSARRFEAQFLGDGLEVGHLERALAHRFTPRSKAT